MTDKITYTREVTSELMLLKVDTDVFTVEGDTIELADLPYDVVDKLIMRLVRDIYKSLGYGLTTPRFGIYRSDDTGQAKSKTELDLKDLKVLKTIIDDTAGSCPGIFDAHVKVNLMIKDLES